MYIVTRVKFIRARIRWVEKKCKSFVHAYVDRKQILNFLRTPYIVYGNLI